jgi:hypothetical protein
MIELCETIETLQKIIKLRTEGREFRIAKMHAFAMRSRRVCSKTLRSGAIPIRYQSEAVVEVGEVLVTNSDFCRVIW